MQNGPEALASYLRSHSGRLKDVEVLAEQFEVCAVEVCDRNGGYAACKGIAALCEVDAAGGAVGPARLFLCTHWCHNAVQEE